MHRRYEPSHIPIEILRSFVSVLDTGSFTKAAARLNITQPAISAQVKRLQILVGEELFRKEGPGIALTEKGESVCRYARRILALNDQILWSGRCEKKFRIGLPSVLGGLHLGGLKQALEAENFRSVQIVCERSDLLLKRTSAGLLDVAVAFNTADSADLAPSIEWQESLVWVCHPDFVLSPGAPIPLLRWPNTVTDQIAVRACEQGEVSYMSEFVGDQLAALIEAVELRLGYFCAVERTAPAGMKISKDYFLPKLPALHGGIYKSADCADARVDTLVKCLGRIFNPTRTTKLNDVPGGATTMGKHIPTRGEAGEIDVLARDLDARTLMRAAVGRIKESKQYRDKADAAREMADAANTVSRRDSLLSIAANYEHTAERLETLSTVRSVGNA